MKLDNKLFAGIVLILIAAFFFIVFGMAGLRLALVGFAIFILPVYLILNNFDLTSEEKLIFSFFLGIGIFPSIVYLLGLVISFRIGIIITFILMILIGFALKKYKQKK